MRASDIPLPVALCRAIGTYLVHPLAPIDLREDHAGARRVSGNQLKQSQAGLILAPMESALAWLTGTSAMQLAPVQPVEAVERILLTKQVPTESAHLRDNHRT
jgi:hypothetical protein